MNAYYVPGSVWGTRDSLKKNKKIAKVLVLIDAYILCERNTNK